MDSSEKSNSSSHAVVSLATQEDEDYKVVPAKKVKLTTSAAGLASRKNTKEVTEAESINAVLISPNSSFSQEEFVFSIDHILESVLMECDPCTLVNCRLVSRRWAVFGSKELKKTFNIKIIISSTLVRQRYLWCVSGSCQTQSIEDLINQMNNSTEFPCTTSFDFLSDIAGMMYYSHGDKPEGPSNMEIARPFLNAHGATVDKIWLRQDVLFEDLKHLLLKQAPNLQYLYLGQMDFEFEDSSYTEDEEEEEETERDRRAASLFDENISNSKPFLKNLKKFKCHSWTRGLGIFIKQILECSPNLGDVALPSDYLHLLGHPINRVHLLKKISMYLCNSNIEPNERFADFLQDNENLEISEVYFSGSYYNEDEEYNGYSVNQEFNERVVNVMGKILNVCSATCQKLVWHKGVDQLQFPQMPYVKHLTIQYYKEGEGTWVPDHSLGDSVSIGYTFPSLQSVEIRTDVGLADMPLPNIFNDEDHIAAAKVQKVTLRMPFNGKRLLQGFKDMFPNATLRRKFLLIPANGYDDEDFNDDQSDEEETDDGEYGDEENADGESGNDQNDDGESNDDENEDGESRDEEIEEGESGDDENESGESGDEEIEGGETGDDENGDGESGDEDKDDGESNENENFDKKSVDGESDDE